MAKNLEIRCKHKENPIDEDCEFCGAKGVKHNGQFCDKYSGETRLEKWYGNRKVWEEIQYDLK